VYYAILLIMQVLNYAIITGRGYGDNLKSRRDKL